MSNGDSIHWRWRFQPVWGLWGHLGVDYTFDDPFDAGGEHLLRHLDYGLPGDRAQAGYRHSIARYCALVAPGGQGWPPLRTPRGFVFVATEFVPAPRAVGDFLLHASPRFWGACGAYRRLGPNSNTGLRRTLELCTRQTGYAFPELPPRIRFGAIGWGWRGDLDAGDGPYPGYFDTPRFRFSSPIADAAQAERHA